MDIVMLFDHERSHTICKNNLIESNNNSKTLKQKATASQLSTSFTCSAHLPFHPVSEVKQMFNDCR